MSGAEKESTGEPPNKTNQPPVNRERRQLHADIHPVTNQGPFPDDADASAARLSLAVRLL